MRLDLVLKDSCLIKRRTIAKELCYAGKVTVNGKVAKPSTDVVNNSIITIKLGTKTINVKITYIQKGKRDIPTYEEIPNNAA